MCIYVDVDVCMYIHIPIHSFSGGGTPSRAGRNSPKCLPQWLYRVYVLEALPCIYTGPLTFENVCMYMSISVQQM